MALEVAIYGIERHRRSLSCCQAMFAGIRSCGDRPVHLSENSYVEPAHDLAVFYGYTATLRRVMADYIKTGRKAVYIDLGYWKREGLTGHHKITVNDRHPTAYFQKVKHSNARARLLGVAVDSWRRDREDNPILLAGMGDKAAEAEGRKVEQWEREAIDMIRRFSDRPIIYRPKPSWKQARPLPGTAFSPEAQPLTELFRTCHAVVTHHSNVAVEGIVAGVPAFCWKGVAVPMSLHDIAEIEEPYFPAAREQWINDIAYTQWNISEMTAGKPWRHMKDEGLI